MLFNNSLVFFVKVCVVIVLISLYSLGVVIFSCSILFSYEALSWFKPITHVVFNFICGVLVLSLVVLTIKHTGFRVCFYGD